jgi:uncharacterized repeat protein (TIGR02543 family)
MVHFLEQHFYLKGLNRMPRNMLFVNIVMLLCCAAVSSALSITYTYDSDGQLTRAAYSSGESITYTYDAAGNILTRVVAGGTPQTYTLSVSKPGTGGGTVTSDPSGISCGATCNAAFNNGAAVALTATADTGSSFTGWSGTCTETGSCSVTMDGDKTVTATFTLNPINGFCGTANGQSLTTAPTADLCATGTATLVNGPGPWSWYCNGANDGSTASCTATLQVSPVNGACGAASTGGQSYTTAPTADLCSAGTATTVTYSMPMWSWRCEGTAGGSTIACMANSSQTTPVNGVCGPANGQIATAAPTADLCSAGTASAVSGGGPWTWSCTGSNGMPLNCSTSGATQSNVKGDINNDNMVTLADAVSALQVSAGMKPVPINSAAGFNNGGRIGLAEVIYVLQKVAGLREVSAGSGVMTGTNLSLISQGQPAKGFIFATGAIVTGPTMGDFMINSFTSPNSASGFLMQGISTKDLGQIGSLDTITEAPATGYASPQSLQLTAGRAYAFQLTGGKYGVLVVKSVTSSPITMTFDYKYQPNGSRTF